MKSGLFYAGVHESYCPIHLPAKLLKMWNTSPKSQTVIMDLKRQAGSVLPVLCPQKVVTAMLTSNRGDNRRGLNG